MKFEIRETNYDISEEDLILDLRETCLNMNKNSLTIAEYNRNGKYSAAAEQKNVELEKGFADMKEGHSKSAKMVFADIRKDYNK